MTSRTERILIVDQTSEIQAALTKYLSDKGFLVSSCADLETALTRVDDNPPDVIFADLGPKAIAELSSQCRVEDGRIPVVVCSHAKQVDDVLLALRAGASDFLNKPLDDHQAVDGVLGKLFDQVRLTRLNQVYRQELEESNRHLREGIAELRADQSAGRKVQMRMLPEHNRQIGDIHLDHLVKPSLYLSGDFLDYFRLDDNRMLVYIADVSGHGASSAFVTVLLKNLTNRLQRNLRRGSSDDIRYPDRFLHRVNKELLDTRLGKHLTLFVGIIDTAKHEMSYAVGAHFPMPILAAGGEAHFLEGSGLPVGLFEEPSWDIYHTSLPQNFSLLLFSDGILEVIKANSLDEKENRLLEVVSAGGHTIASLSEALALDEISELPDDIAIVTVTDMAAS